jgi:predicted aspartyl protease
MLLRAQVTRQGLERDETLMRNRLKMLQLEEEKMLKKIEKTRVQAELIN